MIKSDSLYMLIKSMTKAEKRYFKLYTSINAISGDKDYVRLFDAIEAQDIYDEKAILDKFKNEPYFSQLKSVKFYLYKQIIKSLKNIHEDASGSIRLENYLIEIHILYKKGLFKNCTSTIKKAKAYAQKIENFPKLLELLAWESRIVIWQQNVDQVELLKQKWSDEELGALKKYTEIIELKELSINILSFIFRKGYAKTEGETKFIENVLSNKLLEQEKSSFAAELNRQTIIGNCLATLGRREERYELVKKTVDFYDRFPQQVDLRINECFYNMTGLVNLALALKKATYAGWLIQKLRVIYENKYTYLDIKNKVGYLNIQFQFLLFKGEFAQALDQIIEIDNLREKSNRELDAIAEIHLHELKFCIYFCNREFKKAQFHVREIINSTADVRLDVQISARIAYLIMQYEEREYTHLEYAWRSTYRYLLKKERLDEAEGMVLHFLRNAPKFNSEREILAALGEFRDLVRPYMDQFMVEFPLLEWIDSKIQNKDLVAVVRKQYLTAIANEEEQVSHNLAKKI